MRTEKRRQKRKVRKSEYIKAKERERDRRSE